MNHKQRLTCIYFLWLRMKTIVGLDKNMIHCRDKYEKAVKAKKKVVEVKYTVYEFAIAFQYWSYKAII